MTMQLAIRFSDEEIQLLDEIVEGGDAESRSAAVRYALAHLGEARRLSALSARDRAAYESHPQSDADHVWSTAAAIAMIEAEDWSEWYPPSRDVA